jgi:hypothetical protein
MMKKLALVLLVLAFCGAALAADPSATPVSGKITTVGDGKVTITLDGEKATWVKKNAPVKFTNGIGKILEVSADGVSPVVITIKTRKAGEMKVGDSISLQKGKPTAGC